mgnify:CR=1 FL=1
MRDMHLHRREGGFRGPSDCATPPPKGALLEWRRGGVPLTKLLATDGEGERLDRYELIAELASGGMATVFLARLVGVAGFQRMVAIKRLHPHLAREREFVDMFLDEARLAARIHHPNVVPILEVGESERGYYLVMEYVEGDTAARLFARSAQAGKRVPHDVAVRVVLDSLAGLHAAHELKDDENKPLELVHRDVSPQNILVGIDGTSRITDFGVARAASRLSTTRSGQLKGKLSYMAPEQARGVAIDRRADVFAMGIVLWEALAFKRLFKGEGEAETLNRVLYEPIPTLKSAMPTIPDALDAVVMKALEREPDKRFASAADLVASNPSRSSEPGCLRSISPSSSNPCIIVPSPLGTRSSVYAPYNSPYCIAGTRPWGARRSFQDLPPSPELLCPPLNHPPKPRTEDDGSDAPITLPAYPVSGARPPRSRGEAATS